MSEDKVALQNCLFGIICGLLIGSLMWVGSWMAFARLPH